MAHTAPSASTAAPASHSPGEPSMVKPSNSKTIAVLPATRPATSSEAALLRGGSGCSQQAHQHDDGRQARALGGSVQLISHALSQRDQQAATQALQQAPGDQRFDG